MMIWWDSGMEQKETRVFRLLPLPRCLYSLFYRLAPCPTWYPLPIVQLLPFQFHLIRPPPHPSPSLARVLRTGSRCGQTSPSMNAGKALVQLAWQYSGSVNWALGTVGRRRGSLPAKLLTPLQKQNTTYEKLYVS